MKISQKQALAFFLALNFGKAAGWSKEKMVEKLKLVPDNVKKDQVPEGFEDFHAKLCEAGKDIELEVEEGAAPEEPKVKPAPKPKAKAKAKAKPAKAKAKKEKSAKEKVKTKPLENSKIGSVISADWQNDTDIAKAAGLTLKQARSRLRHACHRGLMETQRLSQYRLVKPAAKE